ncbi:hypothetical protein AAC387_Pa01g1347 [Persea americana]
MKSDSALDYAIFQLSPKRSRCELFVSGEGKTEKLASGLVKPFVSNLKVAEEQVAQAVQSIKLEVGKQKDVGKWFTKGTLERFVRFVSTPEVLELVNTFDAEMSQLEVARRIYAQGAVRDQHSGENETGAAAAADVTKKELLRAIDVRLVAVKQDLCAACARASAAGFNPDNVSELLLFADRFGAHRLKDACSNFISLCQRQPELVNSLKAIDDPAIRSSFGSDMSIDDTTEEMLSLKSIEPQQHRQHSYQCNQEQDTSRVSDLSKPAISQPKLSTSAGFPACRPLREPSSECDEGRESELASKKDTEKAMDVSPPLSTQQPARRLSVQDRINMFENKQKEQSGSGSGVSKTIASGKVPDLRRLSSDISSSSAASSVVEKAVLRRWSGATDMSVEISGERKENDHCDGIMTPTSLKTQTHKDVNILKDTAISQSQLGSKEDLDSLQTAQFRAISGSSADDAGLQEQATSRTGIFPVKGDCGRAKDQNVSDIFFKGSISGMTEDVGLNDAVAAQGQNRTLLSGAEHVRMKDQGSSWTQSGAVLTRTEHPGYINQVAFHTESNTPSGSVENVNWKVSASSQGPFKALSSRADERNHDAPQISLRASPRTEEDVGLKGQPASLQQSGTHPSKTEEVFLKSKDLMGSQFQVKAFPGKAEDIAKDPTTSQTQYKSFAGGAEVAKSDPSISLSQWRAFPGKAKEVVKKEAMASQAQHGASVSAKLEESKERDSGVQGMKLHRQTSASEQNKRFQVKQDQNTFLSGNEEPCLMGRKASQTLDTTDQASINIFEPIQKARQSKGNQELNDELQVKANELEKLFAAHKRRVPGDQMASARRSKMVDAQVEQHFSAVEKKLGKGNSTQLFQENEVRQLSGNFTSALELDVSLLMKIVDGQANSSKQPSNFGPSEDIRGKFYERYMQKRDAKLKEEWVSKRAQKEAKMKEMHDCLERSKAEMEAKFSVSADRQDSGLHVRRRAERLRSFSSHSSMKNREQHQLEEPFQSDEEEDLPTFSEETHFGQDATFNETLSGDGSLRSIQSKKPLSNKGFSSTSRTTVAPVPRLSVKTNNSGSGRRRPENPLTNSVPNLSDLRKENTKPSTGISKTVTRSQVRNYIRSRSTSEDISLVKEEKPQRSQSMRKSTASTCELEDPSPLNSDSSVLAPLRFSKEQTEQSLYNKMLKNGELKPFLRKGNGIGPGSGAGIAKLKSSLVSDNLKNGEESEELADHPEDSRDMSKSKGEEEFERVSAEENFKMGGFPAELDSEKLSLSQESEKYDLGSENGEVLQSLSQVDDNTAAAVVSVSSRFNTSLGTVQDSPGESPASWNSRMYNTFSYSRDASDVDVSADSPIGSPTSWNSHSMAQMMEADAARMRKKWGSTQKPILVANTSQHSRKDVTKGFKRLLKFGRKSKGAESLITDWVSASTTSEGDDDNEDGRDSTNRLSEDLRKTRMGLSQYHPSFDGFNEGEIFNDQVQSLCSSIPVPPVNFKLREDHISGSSLKAPRSFFSLSSFRSKGSESKPR